MYNKSKVICGLPASLSICDFAQPLTRSFIKEVSMKIYFGKLLRENFRNGLMCLCSFRA